MTITHRAHIWITALAVAWCFDLLFWKKEPGISLFIFALLCLGAGFFLAWVEKRFPAPASLGLLPPVLFFAATTFLRQEPFTVFVSFLLAVGGMLVMALTWLGGGWLRYSLSDYAINTLRLIGDTLVMPVQFLLPAQPKAGASPGEASEGSGAAPGRARWAGSVLLGLFLAFPVVAVLGALLSAADPIFSDRLGELLNLVRIDRLDEYLIRLTYILVLAFLLIGIFLHALLSSRGEKLTKVAASGPLPFLGWLEAAIVLGGVDLMFGFFVLIQLQYFFGGRANIAIDGLTYAEYARRGFGELVAVAALSLLLFLGLGAVTRRDGRLAGRLFSGLGAGLVALVSVILVSAFQRLLLYEAAYGFTRIRTYTHVFMVWLGILLLATVVLEIAGRLRRFAFAAVLASLGFGVTLVVLNVDAFITRQNVARAVSGEALDSAYLVSLSEDAAPALFDLYLSGPFSPELRDEVGAVLACRSALAQESAAPLPWPSYRWPRARALTLYQAHKGELAAYPARQADGEWMVTIDGAERPCVENRWMDD